MPNERIAAGQQKEQMGQQKQQQWQAGPIAEDGKYDRYGRKRELSREYNAQEWKDRLFEINGVRNTLRHKSTVSQDSTNSFVFLQNEMPLNPGLTLQLEEKEGQVVEFEERADQEVQQDQAMQPNQAAQDNRRSGLIFSGFGGKLRFQSASMPQIQEQELAVTTIEIPAAEPGQTAKAKISASLLDTVTIEPSPGMKLELKNGQLTNAGNTEKAVLHFDTAVWLDGKQLADHIRLKYDDAGLQVEEGEKALLDINKLDYAREKQEAMRRDQVLSDSELQMKLVLDEDKGVHIGMDVMHKVASMKLGEINFQLKNPEGLPGHFHNAEEADAIFLGSELHMQNLSIGENVLEGELARTTYLGAEVTMKNSLFDAKGILKAKELTTTYQGEKLDLENAELREEHILWAETGSGKLNGQDIKLFHMHLGKEQLLEAGAAEMTIEGFSTQLQNYSYQAGQTNAYESAKVMTKIYAGLDKESKDAAQQKDEPEDLFAFTLAAGQIQDAGFEKDIQGEETLSHSNFTEKTLYKKEIKEGILLKRKIFTRDGFAELQVEKMQFQKGEEDAAKVVGMGTFKLREIPYTLTTRKGKELNGIAYSPENPLKGIDFTIDSQGLLSADFEDEEAEMNLKRVFVKKFENAGESGVKKIKLSGLGIENGFLKVSSVRMDRGFGINQEPGEKEEEDTNAQKTLKDIFGECNFSATIANISENVQMTPKGIEVQQDDKYKLGTVGVEGLFGFLSGEIDYPEGTVSVSAEKGVETPETPSFLNIPKLNGNLGAGVSIPIPGAPLSVELGVNPSASFGGKVSVEVSRGKSFGDPWNEEKEELGIKGGLEAEAKAGIEAYMGIAAGAGQIASISLQLNGNLGAELKGALELKSKLEKEQGKKMKQAEDFQFSGGIEGVLKAGLSLSSDVKLLFWKTQIFEIKLIEKELGKLSLEGSGSKSKDSEGLTEGWNFEKLQFTAESLKNKTQLELKNGLEGSISLKAMKLRKLENILEGAEEEAKIAWETLEQLKDKEENMIYVLSLKEKEALEKQIKSLTEEVTVKISKCLNLLRKSEEEQVKKEIKEEITLKQIEKKLEDEKKRNEEAVGMMQAAETGGFQKKNFVGLKGIFANGVYESEVARLGIAMLIGEYENGETRFRSSVHKDTLLKGESQLEVDLKTFMESRVLDQGLTAREYDSPATPPLSMADAMYMNSSDHAKYQDLLQSYPNLTFRELLGYAMKGEYVDPGSGETKKLPQGGEELRDLLKACLKATVKYHKISEGASDKSAQEKSYKEQYDLTKQIIEERFKRVFTTSYKAMTTKAVFKNPDDIWGDIVKIEQNIEIAKNQKQKTQQALQKTRDHIAEIRIKQNEYMHNLASLQSNALDALQDKKFDSDKAAVAVHILTEDYDKKMKDGKEILQSLSEADPNKELLTGVMQGKDMTERMKAPLNV